MAFSNYTISRTQPVPLGIQDADKSLPVVITNDENIVINVKQEAAASEVALSLLGIPRAETALGVFADITTYGIDKNVWTTFPLVYDPVNSVGVRFLQNQSAASIESANNYWAGLNTNRAFPYLPGRVSSGTFGVRHGIARPTQYSGDAFANEGDNPCRKWGMLTDKDGYYFEIYGDGIGQFDSIYKTENPDLGVPDKFRVVRRTSGIPRLFFINNYSSAYNGDFYTNFYQETAVPTTVTEFPVLSAPYMVVVDSLSCFHACLHDVRIRTTRTENICATQVTFQHGPPGQEITKTYFVNPDNALIYEYRVPRSWFNFDKLDGLTDSPIYYSDVVKSNNQTFYPGDNTTLKDDSVWTIDFSKTTMYKIEYSWYGAVGALFLAYLPVGGGDARWVRVHHLRGSNQLSVPTLGNPYLPISYYVYNSGGIIETSEKYGASYYIDGAEKGSVKIFSAYNPTGKNITTGAIPVSAKDTVITTQYTLLSSSNRELFLNTDIFVPRIVTFGRYDEIITSFYQGAYIDGTVFYIDANNVLNKITVPSGKVFISQIKIDRGTHNLNPDTGQATLTSYALLNTGFITTPWKALTANLRAYLPRGNPLVNIRMRTKFGQADVSSKASVFPVRLNVGTDLPGSAGSGQIRLTKNPAYPDYSSNISIDQQNIRQIRASSITLSAGTTIPGIVAKVPVGLNPSNWVSGHYMSPNTFISGYLQGIPGRLERSSTGQYTFQRYREGAAAIVTGSTSFWAGVNNNNIGPDQFIFEPGWTAEGTVFTSFASFANADVFSAVEFKVDEQRLFMANTGNTINSFAVSNGGADFDLSGFFDFNREFLAGAGLSTGTVLQEELAVTGLVFDPNEIIRGGSNGFATASLTWEEQ